MKYRVFIEPTGREFKETEFVPAAGLFDGTYLVGTAGLTLQLTKEERDQVINTWNRCDAINDEWRAKYGDAPVDHSNPEYAAFMEAGLNR